MSTPASVLAVLNATAPLWGTFFAWLILKEKVTWLQWAGVLVGFFGVWILADPKGDVPFVGYLAGIIASASYGLAAVVIRKYSFDLPARSLAAGSQLGAAIVLFPGACIQTWGNNFAPVSHLPALFLFILGVMCSGIAYLIYFRLLKDEGPRKSILVTLLIPVFGMLWGAIFLSETISNRMILGASFILIGMGLSTYKGAKAKKIRT